MAGVTYDKGALLVAERNDRAMWALHMGFLALDVVPVVPAPVLAEAWRKGARHSSLAKFLEGCVVEDLDDTKARRVGVLAGRTKFDDIVNVAVVEGALRRNDDVIVTSNASRIRTIADAARRRARLGSVYRRGSIQRAIANILLTEHLKSDATR